MSSERGRTGAATETGLSGAAGRPSDRRRWAIVAVTVLLAILYLPFLNKPFTIDDTVVLTVARQILQDPLRPFDTTINWFGDPEPMFEVTTNPPFVSYWLAPVLAIFGLNEVALHLWQLPWVILMAAGVGVLSRRFCGGSLWPVLLVLSSPAVAVSVNCMRDVPAAAMATAGIAFFVSGSDARDWRRLLGGGLLVGFAAFSKYPHIAMVLVMALYVLLHQRPKHLLWLLVPLAILGLWFLQNRLGHDLSHLAYLKAERSDDTSFTWWMKLYAAVTILGSSLLLAPILLLRALGRWRQTMWLAAVGVAAVFASGLYLAVLTRALGPAEGRSVAVWFVQPWRSLDVQHAFWTAMGGVMLAGILAAALGRRAREGKAAVSAPEAASAQDSTAGGDLGRGDAIFLVVWLLVPLIVSSFFIFFQAVRHQIPVIPPLAVLAVALLRRDPGRYRGAVRAGLAVAVAMQAGLSLVVGYADYEFADAHRDFADHVETRYHRAGEEVWFRGNWGYQTYARRAGHHQIARSGEAPPAGALVVWPANVHFGGLPDGLSERLDPVETFTREQRLPVHTMTRGAGFYATVGTHLPFRFGARETWTGEIYRVRPAEPMDDHE